MHYTDFVIQDQSYLIHFISGLISVLIFYVNILISLVYLYDIYILSTEKYI